MVDSNNNLIIQIGTQSIKVKLRKTACAQAIYAGLPYQSNAQTWGDEVYFSIPVDCELEPDAKDVVNKGEDRFLCRRRLYRHRIWTNTHFQRQ